MRQDALPLAAKYCGQYAVGPHAGMFAIQSSKEPSLRARYWLPGFHITVAKLVSKAAKRGHPVDAKKVASILAKKMSNKNGDIQAATSGAAATRASTRRAEAAAWEERHLENFESGGYPSNWAPFLKDKLPVDENGA